MVVLLPGPGQPKFQPGLFLDAFQRPDWDIPFRMRDGNAASYRRMLELLVTANLFHLAPAVSFKNPDNLAAVHLRFFLKRRLHQDSI